MPDPPDALEHLWQWFLKLHNRRQYGFGANPLTSSEIEAWARQSRIIVTPWEFDALCRVDDAVVPILNRPKSAIESNTGDGKRVAERLRARGTVKAKE